LHLQNEATHKFAIQYYCLKLSTTNLTLDRSCHS